MNHEHNMDMGSRGVRRPTMGLDKKHEEGKDDQEMGNMKMDKDQRMQMLHMHYMQTLWIYWLLVILGIWMILFPLTFGYD